MIGTSAIRNLIREAKVAQMYSAIQTGNSFGMQTLDQNLTDLVKRNHDQPGRSPRQGQDPRELPRLKPSGRTFVQKNSSEGPPWNATRPVNSSTTCSS